MSAIFDRQNDEKAMTYIKASRYCYKQKLIVTYYMIIVSLLVTAASIAVRILEKSIPNFSSHYSQLVVLISGVVLISNIFCSFLEYEFNILSVNLLERYDIYVFNLPVNKALLRPIAEQTIINYARKFKNTKKIMKLRNYYFKTPEEAEQKNASFFNIKKSFEYSHRLLLNIHGFFMLLWIGFAVMIMLVAFTMANEKFIDNVINIFVPSLSTISLIASAWRRYNAQSRKLANGVNVTTELLTDASQKEPKVSLQSQYIIRGLQDALFNMRVNDFTVPEVLVKRFNKRLKFEEELLRREAEMGQRNFEQDKPKTKQAKPVAKQIKPSENKLHDILREDYQPEYLEEIYIEQSPPQNPPRAKAAANAGINNTKQAASSPRTASTAQKRMTNPKPKPSIKPAASPKKNTKPSNNTKKK